MSNIDDELIDEAVNEPKKKRLPVLRITAAAAAFVFIALAAAVLAGINTHTNNISEAVTSNAQTSKEADNVKPKNKDEGTASAQNGESSTKSADTQQSKTKGTNAQGSSGSAEKPDESTPAAQSGEQKPAEPKTVDEESDVLGFIIIDEKVYMQVFNNTEYTLDRDIGRAGDFRGFYNGLADNSRVYTVREDEKILVVKLENGGSVTLMLDEESLHDNMGYYRFKHLRVDRSLMAALSSNDGKSYSVNVTRPDSDDMYEYVYNGKTLRQMKEELEESWKTFDGKTNPLETEYQAALDAFLKEKIKAIYDILIADGIKAELVNGVRCEAEMTKEQFERFDRDYWYLDEYAFSLRSDGYFNDDPEA